MRGFKGRIMGWPQAALAASVLSLLSGCGWLGIGGSSLPADMAKARPGAERDVQPTAVLPPPPANQQYDPAIAPVDDMRNAPQIGSIVAASGGQAAQLEKQAKEEAAQDAQERAAREKAEAAAKEAEKDAAKTSGAAREATATGDQPAQPPTQPVAPSRGAVNGTPMPSPADSGPSTPSNPPVGPNAQTKPAGT
jgi:hypothetical protein